MNESRILAAMGHLNVTEAEVDAMIASLSQRGKNYNTPEGRRIVLDQLIQQKLILLDATRNLLEREPEFKAQLAKVKDDLLVNYAVSKTLSSVRVTEEEIQKYYAENPDDFRSEKAVNASHILVADEMEAKNILAQIQAGEITFEEAAKKHSTCPSGVEGGNLGDFGQGQMVPEFDEACFSMEEGELRGPIQTQFGYHLIRLNKIHEASQLKLHEVRDEIRARLMGEKQQAAYQSKINQLKILYPVEMF